MTTPPLFDQPVNPPLGQSKHIDRLATEKATWTRLHSAHRQQCSECVLVLHEHHGVGQPIRSARWRLRVTDQVYLLCEAHARLRRGETPI